MKMLRSIKLWYTMAIIAAILFLILLWNPHQRKSKALIIAAGDPNGQYYKKAKEISSLLQNEFKIRVEVLATKGSSDNLNLVSRGEAHVVFFQSGSDVKTVANTQNVLSIADLFQEGVFLVVRRESHLSSISDLEAKNVACGPIGSGTNRVVTDLYRLAKIKINDRNFQTFDFERAKEGLESGRLDAAFFVISPEASFIKDLLQNLKLTIFSMEEFIPAYRAHLSYLSELFIPKGLYSMREPISPDKHIATLSTSAEIIYSRNIDPWHLECLLRVIKEMKWEKGYPNTEALEFPTDKLTREIITSGFKWYHDRRIPFVLRRNLHMVLFASVLVPVIFVFLKILPGLLKLPALPILIMKTMSMNRFYEKIAKDSNREDILSLVEELQLEMIRVNGIWASLPWMNSVKREWISDLTNLAAHLKLLVEYRQYTKLPNEELKELKHR